MIFLLYSKRGETKRFHGTFDSEHEAIVNAEILVDEGDADVAYVKQFGVGTVYYRIRMPKDGYLAPLRLIDNARWKPKTAKTSGPRND